MNNENSLSASGAPYEYTVKEAHSSALIFKRVTLIAIYALWVAGLVLAGVLLKAPVPMAAIALISVWVLYFFTWRLTQVEYEYSFFAGTLTVCRVLGGRSRRVSVQQKKRRTKRSQIGTEFHAQPAGRSRDGNSLAAQGFRIFLKPRLHIHKHPITFIVNEVML